MYLLAETGHLDFHPKHLFAERVEPHLIGQGERLSVVFHRVLGLHVDVGVVEGAAQFGGYGLRVGGEVGDYVALVDVVCVYEHSDAEGDSGRLLERLLVGGQRGRGVVYMANARVMEKGYSLKSLIVASRVDAFLRAGDHGEYMFLFGSGRLLRSEETLWKADGHFGRSCSTERRPVVRMARGHALANIVEVSARKRCSACFEGPINGWLEQEVFRLNLGQISGDQ